MKLKGLSDRAVSRVARNIKGQDLKEMDAAEYYGTSDTDIERFVGSYLELGDYENPYYIEDRNDRHLPGAMSAMRDHAESEGVRLTGLEEYLEEVFEWMYGYMMSVE